jgi:hypothetical protein
MEKHRKLLARRPMRSLKTSPILEINSRRTYQLACLNRMCRAIADPIPDYTRNCPEPTAPVPEFPVCAMFCES